MLGTNSVRSQASQRSNRRGGDQPARASRPSAGSGQRRAQPEGRDRTELTRGAPHQVVTSRSHILVAMPASGKSVSLLLTNAHCTRHLAAARCPGFKSRCRHRFPDATTILGMRFRFNGRADGDIGAFWALKKETFVFATHDCRGFSAAFVHR